MKFSGTYWLAIQDIGGFTALSEQLARKGKTGTEELYGTIAKFFKGAEEIILNHNGRIFKLAGDAYYAIFPPEIEEQRIKLLGNALINLKVLLKTGLKTRFVAVRGPVDSEWIQVSDNYKDLLISGKAIHDLDLLEENTPAGKANLFSIFQQPAVHSLPIFPSITKKVYYQAAHRPLYIAFIELSQDFELVHKVTHFFLNQHQKIKILKWIPSKNTFKGLLISGFPTSTGREAEFFIDLFNDLKGEFKDYKFRMGVSAGVVFASEIKTKKFREFAIFGDRVNTAARLCAIAPDNGIYLSKEIEESLRGKFNLINVGKIALKGKVEKVSIYRPQEKLCYVFNRSLFPFKFVGRERELNYALGFLKKRQSLCVVGDAGMGKSRLLYELRNRIKQKNIIEIAIPPMPPPLFLLKDIVKHFPLGEFPELKGYFDGSFQLSQVKVIELLRKLFRTRKKLTIFIEDLHWIDNASFIILKELVPLPFLILTSSRPDGERIVDTFKIKKIFLKNLPRVSLICLFKTIFGMPPDKKLFDFLSERAQGNPFYFEQILKDMQEKNLFIKKEKEYSLAEDAHSLPFSIHSILLSRFDDLPEDVRKVLEIGACIGREFSLETVNKLIANKSVSLETACQREIVLRTGEIYQFKHALFQETILDSILDTRRKIYERKIGEVFIKEKREPYDIATHLTVGNEPYKALPYWRNTFEEFHARGLHNELFRIIQKLINDKDERTREVGKLINALYLVKMADYYDAEEIFLNLKKNKRLRKQALFGLAGLYDWSGQYDKMKKTINELKGFKMNISEKLEHLELCGIYYDMMGQNKIGFKYYKKALQIAQKNNFKDSIAVSLYNIGWIYFKEGKYKKAEEFFQRSLNFIDKGDLFSEGTCLLRIGQIEMLKHNFEISLNYLKKTLKNFQTLGFTYWESLTLSAFANLYIMLGKKQKAFSFARKSAEAARMANLTSNCIYLFYLYYGMFSKFEEEIKGKEKKFAREYFLYLLAKNKREEAMEFLKKHNLEHIIPNKRALKEKNLPLNFLTLYKKYGNG